MCTAIINDKAVDMKNENTDNTEVERIGDTITLVESCDEINSEDDPLILGLINDKMHFQSSSGHNFETPSKIPLKKHYFCSNCPEKFLFPSLLKKHCRSFHNSPATYLCSECNKMCPSMKQLWEHKRQEHTKEKKEYLCNWCDESFTDNLSLKKHLQSIHSKKRSQGYLCNCCGKSFSCSGNFKQHVIKVHSKNPPRELCNICGKTVSCLKVHLPIHSEEYYECAECGQRLKWRSSLITHLQVHSSERALPCTVCDKAFKDKVKLLQHMRTHTGETPWVCEHCGRSFNRKWNHIQHVRLHTGVKPYVCAVCGEAFRHNVTMKKHAEKHKAPSDIQGNNSFV
uniref:C2H2-type domain-containing protein n=1 Tax=Timema shepardi TaxID=629360 RepID=A0A7R9AWA6_TIMSH|nr:unnamed protein product [Timema shepardi]